MLDKLVTEGGKMAILLSLLMILIVVALVLHETNHDPAETGRTLLSNSFTSVFTAIMLKLTGEAKRS